jgi:hypothetical protein
MPEPQDTTTGTLALIFGILGCVNILPCLGPLLALIFGYSSRGTAGEGNGRIGRILGWLAICIVPLAVGIVMILNYVVFFWF